MKDWFCFAASLAILAGQVALAQTATPPATPPATPVPHKAKPPAKPSSTTAVWAPDVQQALNVSATDFAALGLNKLTKAQLQALEVAARNDPNKHLLTCPASGTLPVGRIHVFLTVAGDDSTGAIAGQIKQAIGSLSEVDLVEKPAQADRTLHVVIQEQTTAKRTIGFTASYLTGTPCIETVAGKAKDIEMKGTLGTYTDAKGAGLATDLAGMFDQDLQPLRQTATH
ncbi:hypothetical protein [Tunturiibacter lichenicola]|uniref:hypothetical protein n=1 Tax=Tunturiibacter lichenicola TaxID=2051959 RepID=UPI003D9B518F